MLPVPATKKLIIVVVSIDHRQPNLGDNGKILTGWFRYQLIREKNVKMEPMTCFIVAQRKCLSEKELTDFIIFVKETEVR